MLSTPAVCSCLLSPGMDLCWSCIEQVHEAEPASIYFRLALSKMDMEQSVLT